ncbi:hypothetical protein AMATHDRAFT_92395, partial [Amanita thiersii Skay4041]
PAPVQGMTVMPGGNRNAKNMPVGPDGKREWSYDLLDFTSACSTCCLAMYCPCIVHAQNKRRLQHLNEHGTPHPERGDICSSDSWTYFCIEALCDASWILQIATRGAIRERYNIRGSSGDDCVAAFCCGACDLTQGSRELELEEMS